MALLTQNEGKLHRNTVERNSSTYCMLQYIHTQRQQKQKLIKDQIQMTLHEATSSLTAGCVLHVMMMRPQNSTVDAKMQRRSLAPSSGE